MTGSRRQVWLGLTQKNQEIQATLRVGEAPIQVTRRVLRGRALEVHAGAGHQETIKIMMTVAGAMLSGVIAEGRGEPVKTTLVRPSGRP